MDVSDDVLRLVLERVDSHVSLIRAAVVCRRWRCAIADADFLRRFRSLHTPAVAGGYHDRGDVPMFVPSSPPLVDASHFSLDFLPDGAGSWNIWDSRGSLLLMRRSGFGHAFPDMLVCEPLTSRFTIIPPPADFDYVYNFLVCFLVDGYANEAGGHICMSNFRVICMSSHDCVMHAAMCTTDLSWSKKNIGHIEPIHELEILGRAGGSWYFYIEGSRLIEFDGSTGDLTSSVFPDIGVLIFDIEGCNVCVTEGRDGKPRIITVFYDIFKVFARLDSGEWALEESVLLSEATRGLPAYHPSFFNHHQEILTRGTGFVTLSPHIEKPWPYSINLETMEAERATGDIGWMVYRCELPWPPALHACLDRRDTAQRNRALHQQLDGHQ